MKYYAIAATAATFCGAAAADGPEFKFSGFGTLAAVHSNDENSDFVGTLFQPSGAGHTRSWSFDPDTKLGVQGSVLFNDKFSAVVQVVTQHQYDNSYTPQIEWANVKYQVTPELGLRLGRIAAPYYLLSESRFVGYANPWVRPPVDVYSVLPITSNDGLDAIYRSQIGSVNNAVQAYYGTTTAKISSGKAKSSPNWGINDTVEFGSFTFRAGYNALKVDLELESLTPLFDGLNAFAAGAGAVPVPAFQSAATQALALAEKYKLKGMSLSAIALGATYDPGQLFVTGEYVAFKGDGFLADSTSWYVSSGYRFGKFTPYLTYASTKAHVKTEAGISTTGADPLAPGAGALTAGLNATQTQFNATQNTVSAGLRWDVMKNVALKTQYDRVSVGKNSNGRFVTFEGLTPAKDVNVVTIAVDFVF